MSHSVLRKVLNVAIGDIVSTNPLTGIERQQERARKVSDKDRSNCFTVDIASGMEKHRTDCTHGLRMVSE